jgi:hypothetical protein
MAWYPPAVKAAAMINPRTLRKSSTTILMGPIGTRFKIMAIKKKTAGIAATIAALVAILELDSPVFAFLHAKYRNKKATPITAANVTGTVKKLFIVA